MESWKQVKSFLGQRPVHIGFVALIVIMLAILGMQLWFLLRLRQSSSAASELVMRNLLIAVVSEVDDFYRKTADDVLSAAALVVSNDLSAVQSHLQRGTAEGIKGVFILRFDVTATPVLRLYSPAFDLLDLPLDSPEMRAIYLAAAPWTIFPQHPLDKDMPDLAVDARDRNSPIVLKPILDASRHLDGVVGTLIDPTFFREQFLPSVIHRHLERSFPGSSAANVIVTVRDGNGRLAYESQDVQGKGDGVTRRWSFVFTDWRLTIQSRDFTPEQWAQRSFLVNLSLTLVMTGVVMIALFVAMQGALRAVTLSRMKTDFVSNVSHELRTPLSAIQVLAEFLSAGRVKDVPKVRQYGLAIGAEAQRLMQLVDNVLDLAKIESGRKTYSLEEADVSNVVEGALRAVSVGYKERGFSIHYEAAPGSDYRARIDKGAVTEAFLNLLDNAVKYSGASKDVFVNLEQRNESIKVSVTDRGIGIGAEEKDRIFDKFYRVSSGLVHNVNGTGLGLSIAKNIVEAHEGTIKVESALGQGSTFTIYLSSVTGKQDAASVDRGG